MFWSIEDSSKTCKPPASRAGAGPGAQDLLLQPGVIPQRNQGFRIEYEAMHAALASAIR